MANLRVGTVSETSIFAESCRSASERVRESDNRFPADWCMPGTRGEYRTLEGSRRCAFIARHSPNRGESREPETPSDDMAARIVCGT